jgi:transcriptional regulator with XRE-family HTH domain
MDNPALYRVLGRKIASARGKGDAGLSQSALAKKVGLTRGSIANIELGTQRPPLHVVWAIGQALGIEPASLLPHGVELKETAMTYTLDAALEPRVERVVSEMPIARAWLSATRSRVGAEIEGLADKRRKL